MTKYFYCLTFRFPDIIGFQSSITFAGVDWFLNILLWVYYVLFAATETLTYFSLGSGFEYKLKILTIDRKNGSHPPQILYVLLFILLDLEFLLTLLFSLILSRSGFRLKIKFLWMFIANLAVSFPASRLCCLVGMLLHLTKWQQTNKLLMLEWNKAS